MNRDVGRFPIANDQNNLTTTLPKPGPDFVRDAKRLAELVSQESNPEVWPELKRLKASLRETFENAFEFGPDRLRLAERFYDRFATPFGPERGMFDHKSFYQRKGNLVIVSQPYGFNRKELARWSAECGAVATIADQWGHYFPGLASLFFVEFTPQAKTAIDKRIRSRA